jgi:uncharacterized damage-inducible protein DinB
MLKVLQTTWAYNKWAHEQIFLSLNLFDEEEFLTDLGDGCGSVRDKLAHITAADEIWMQRIQGHPNPIFSRPSEFSSISIWRNRAESIIIKYEEYLAGLNEEKLLTNVIYKNLKGIEFSTPVWEILMHVANHATYHRGQVASLIRRIKGKPPVTDMIEYFRFTKNSTVF